MPYFFLFPDSPLIPCLVRRLSFILDSGDTTSYSNHQKCEKQAVARGDLSQKVQVKVQGADLIELKEDINGMVEKLTTFAQEVTRVSLDVGTKGKLGGQAVVEGVEGTWQELTAVVNKLAENLTTQVRVSFYSFLSLPLPLYLCCFCISSARNFAWTSR
jgi:methyl-accepting chemotaxis protein